MDYIWFVCTTSRTIGEAIMPTIWDDNTKLVCPCGEHITLLSLINQLPERVWSE